MDEYSFANQPSAILGGKTRPENTVSSFQHM